MIDADQINEDIKYMALEFGKWLFKERWQWDKGQQLWWRSEEERYHTIADDFLYELFLKRDE